MINNMLNINNNEEGVQKTSSSDFYYENGYKVFTEEYHKKRGFCCGNGCRHCCFEPKYVKYNTQLSIKN